MTASNAPRRRQSVSDLLNTATQVFRVTLLKCLPFAMVAVLCVEVPNIYWLASGHPFPRGMPTDQNYWWLSLATGAVAIYIFSAMMLRQLYVSGGFAVNAKQELTVAARRLPSLLLSWALMQLSIVIGLLLLVVPGVFLFICYLVLLPVVLLEGQVNPFLALWRCVLLVRPNWWRVCAAFVIALLAIGVCFLAFAALLGILGNLLAGLGHAFEAIAAAASIAAFAMVFVFFSALALAIHSSANNSA
jgi:hypothetical protein